MNNWSQAAIVKTRGTTQETVMNKIKTPELSDEALDWAVAKNCNHFTTILLKKVITSSHTLIMKVSTSALPLQSTGRKVARSLSGK